MKVIPLILMGCGGVGLQLIDHIITCRELHAIKGVMLRFIGVCDSRSLVLVNDLSKGELREDALEEIRRVKSSGSYLSTLNYDGCHVIEYPAVDKKLIEVGGLLASSTGLVYIDCSASADTIIILKSVIEIGCFAVLANKKPLTSDIDIYDKLVSCPRHIRYESTVGAGLPVITSLNRLLTSGDPVHRIIGSVSGTLGYVMSELEDGKPFSEVVRAAKQLGFTEPDPRDDLSGMDVARKALILFRLLGGRTNIGNIKVESLYSDLMGPEKMSTQDFLDNGLEMLDDELKKKVNVASSTGNVLRYVCVIEGSSCQVGLLEVPQNSPLGRLKGSDNLIEIYSRCYRELPLVIQGAGAGNDTTAAGVLADIVDLQDLFH
ncbi:uncharacterized protein LOC18425229 isoform X1 [Amborella trichopoda]|uniref:Homoserine dehydrogenase n=2 Tax=Amborella trichopoda TaxID=13333 RepID=W1NR15_AMBTC|nr:uncharacterized protein LOC18425229 isoform X1 [Amborella trichopoda]XP_020517601.1 uncharacterized protein LOC18425229 isoform X1 [Amborella trichopoda]ERM97274.1 hypothetical protein AMTR_s00119p00128340 [Amborella trichopoda]|eukprot:XP_006829858.1 uncharacterized protein LOC18425229 isoform X1 [Amborella trichopoda]